MIENQDVGLTELLLNDIIFLSSPPNLNRCMIFSYIFHIQIYTPLTFILYCNDFLLF